MNEDFSLGEAELSAEDLAILDAFDTLEDWPADDVPVDSSPLTDTSSSVSQSPAIELDDMLTIFLPEVEDDISSMLQALKQLEQEGYSVPAHFGALQRFGHKLRGTAGAVGYLKMSEIASYIETIAEQVVHQLLPPTVGGNAIAYTITVLEFCLYKLVQDSQEPADEAHITNLQTVYDHFSIDLNQPIPADDLTFPTTAQVITETSPLSSTLSSSAHGAISVCAHRFNNLIDYTEKLFEQHTSIENAYRQFETTFQDLQAAQARFHRLEMQFSTSMTQENLLQVPEVHTSSSLITRILNSASTHDGSHTRKNKINKTMHQQTKLQQTSEWDELDIEHYSEKDMLLRSLREAMINIDVSSMHLNTAYHTLFSLQQEYMDHMALVRNETLMMRVAPLSTIVPQLRDIVTMSMFAQEQQVDFEVSNDSIELDKDVLARLSPLLVQMLQTCIANITTSQKQPQSYRIWLRAYALGNDASLEMGFSMAVRGGAVQALREQIRLLNGSLSLERNTVGGISFFLRFPRTRGTTQVLLVRVANQQLLIPLSHIKRIGQMSQDALTSPLYYLGSLLELPTTHTEHATAQPIIFIQRPMEYGTCEPLNILVDEIIDQTELAVRQLKPHLQRPGITGTAIDGSGNVLLLLDVAELVRIYNHQNDEQDTTVETAVHSTRVRPLKILIADDSANMRHSVVQTLEHTTCELQEARDGLETLELLKSNTPDLLLLDIEMPYLNGYDILDILQHNSQFSNVKTIILTSRTSDKHRQHALELGAHAYLTKPSPQKQLLATIQKILSHSAL